MADKEKQLVNEIKQDFKMHEEKHKQIEEMAKEIFNTCAWRFGKPNDYKEIFNDIAEDLTKLNYQKINKDAIVLNKYEYEQICQEILAATEDKQFARKEMAEKILNFVADHYSSDFLISELDEYITKQILGSEV